MPAIQKRGKTYYIADTKDIESSKKIVDQKHLCFLLNKKLSLAKQALFSHKFYFMAVEHNGEMRNAVSAGVSKKDLGEFGENYNSCAKEIANEMLTLGGKSPIGELVEREDGIFALLNLDRSQKLLFTYKSVFQVKMIAVDVEGEQKRHRWAIECVWCDPNVEVKGQVLEQELITAPALAGKIYENREAIKDGRPSM